MKLSNKTYDLLRWIADMVLPALGTLYFALAGIWNFPYGEQIVGTITAIVAFLDVVLGISKRNYLKEQEALKNE
ncbi:MAG: phage holin [Bacteroidales bacterium]|nr:phage holin [Bacteroidales bacterium]